jgi:hypothetical protein
VGLLKWAFYLVLLAAVAWFATSVRLGKHTLWGHLVAIGRTQEAQDLAQGTQEEARHIAEKMREELARDGGVETLNGHDHAPPTAERERATEELRKKAHEEQASSEARPIDPHHLPPRRTQRDRER